MATLSIMTVHFWGHDFILSILILLILLTSYGLFYKQLLSYKIADLIRLFMACIHLLFEESNDAKPYSTVVTAYRCSSCPS